MFIKIIAISAVLLIGLAIFSTQNNTIFSNASSNVIDSMKDNMGNIGTKTAKSVENSLDSSAKLMNEKTNSINNQINSAKESSQDVLKEKISKINILNDIGKIFKNNTIQDSPEPTIISTNPINLPINNSHENIDIASENTDSNAIINEKLSLSSVQQTNGDVLLQYFDVTGNTISANVIIRTSEKEIFSGTFHTSNFKTVINDVSGSPYYMDVIVEHKDYGTVKSSIFNSGTSADYKIIGMFARS
ncbi:MAG: hypothetical protein K8Q89_05355 [Nitrosarchaeum sp.]|nr:hypothetical protein [Nitrosarchaeum sp.]